MLLLKAIVLITIGVSLASCRTRGKSKFTFSGECCSTVYNSNYNSYFRLQSGDINGKAHYLSRDGKLLISWNNGFWAVDAVEAEGRGKAE